MVSRCVSFWEWMKHDFDKNEVQSEIDWWESVWEVCDQPVNQAQWSRMWGGKILLFENEVNTKESAQTKNL